MFGQPWDSYGLGFLFALVLALWAVFHIIGSTRTPPIFKATWTVFVLFVPFIGFLCWLFLGPRAPRR